MMDAVMHRRTGFARRRSRFIFRRGSFGWRAGFRFALKALFGGTDHSRLLQPHRADSGRDVEPRIALNAQRLQSDRFVEAADKGVRAQAGADSGACGYTRVATL